MRSSKVTYRKSVKIIQERASTNITSIRILGTDVFSGFRTSVFGQLMEGTYQSCRAEYGEIHRSDISHPHELYLTTNHRHG